MLNNNRSGANSLSSTDTPRKRKNLLVVAFKHFPDSFLAKAIGITLTSALFIYNFLIDQGFTNIVVRVLITAGVVVLVPTFSLYVITLVRSPRIRRREEIETMRLEHIAHGDLTALKDKAEREGREVVRLEAVASGDRKARGVKDKKEDDRWDLLNERMRIQEAAGLQNQEDRETARQTLATGDAKAQHVKDLKEDERWKQLNERLLQQDQTNLENREVDQQERADDRSSAGDRSSSSPVTNQSRAEDYRFAKAQLVKDAKEDSRWDLLNESLRLQKETVEQASEERILVAQQVKDIKDEGEVMRKGLASDDLEARHVKESKEEKRWTALYERLHIQDMRDEEREQRDARRDQEQMRMRREDDVKDTYRSLFARYIRNNSNTTQGRAVADGLAPIPMDWLEAQPELQKDPSLLLLLVPFNQP